MNVGWRQVSVGRFPEASNRGRRDPSAVLRWWGGLTRPATSGKVQRGHLLGLFAENTSSRSTGEMKLESAEAHDVLLLLDYSPRNLSLRRKAIRYWLRLQLTKGKGKRSLKSVGISGVLLP